MVAGGKFKKLSGLDGTGAGALQAKKHKLGKWVQGSVFLLQNVRFLVANPGFCDLGFSFATGGAGRKIQNRKNIILQQENEHFALFRQEIHQNNSNFVGNPFYSTTPKNFDGFCSTVNFEFLDELTRHHTTKSWMN